MTINEIITLLNADPLTRVTELEERVLRLAWKGCTYSQMAIELHYQDNYLKNLASTLWPVLSRIFGESISKVNFISVLQPRSLTTSQARLIEQFKTRTGTEQIPEPHYGPVPLTSAFYVERPPIENLAYTEVQKPGGVLRIKAPAKMGKTSLLIRVIGDSKARGYRTVNLNLAQVDRAILSNLTLFLRWLCINVARGLDLEPNLEAYWQEGAGDKIGCSQYFRNYLLPSGETPLVLALDEAHQLFEYPDLVKDFFSLLRSWHEESKTTPIWLKLRQIVIYSTDIYVPIRLSESPFQNIGITLTLPEFTLEQVRELAQRYEVNWSEESSLALLRMIGGHPYLLQFTFYHLRWRSANLATLLAEAPTSKGIYSDHLRYLSLVLQDHLELAIAWAKVIESPNPIQIEAITAYKLESLGLIKLENSAVSPSCDLYRLYFQQQLPFDSYAHSLEYYIAQLEQENQRLLGLCLVDELTGLGNRTGFRQTLEAEWRRSIRAGGFLSLILCEIDDFKACFEANGGDSCLQQVGQVIANSARRSADYMARYEGAKFAILLPETNEDGVFTVAETIRARVTQLEIFQGEILGQPLKVTVSLGTICRIASAQESPDSFTQSAENVLEQSRSSGRRLA